MTASDWLFRKPIPVTRAEMIERGLLTSTNSRDAKFAPEVSALEGFLFCALTFEVDPSDRRYGQGKKFFADAFAAISRIRADGVCPGRVDRMEKIYSQVFTPGIGYYGCLLRAGDYARAILNEEDFVEGPLVIGMHNFEYGSGYADWNGDMGSVRISIRPRPGNFRVWSGDEEKGFVSVYGQDLSRFARGMVAKPGSDAAMNLAESA